VKARTAAKARASATVMAFFVEAADSWRVV